MDDKENTAPPANGIAYVFGAQPVSYDVGKKGRSKSMGPGGASPAAKRTYDRRKSALPVAVRSILPNQGDEERKAARRKSMADRRVSFAVEATLHTWDVTEYLREHTNSTGSTDGSRRSPRLSADGAANAQPEDWSFDEGESEGSSDEEHADDNTMSTSLSIDNDTQHTSGSNASSTSSSAQLERNLRMAAETAGTRGIQYDEFGDMSMEMAEEEITNAFQPWISRDVEERRGSAAYDQENMDPFIEQSAKTNHVLALATNIDLPVTAENPSDDEQTMDFTSVALQQDYLRNGVSSSPLKRSATQMGQDAPEEYAQQSPRKRIRLDETASVNTDPETMQFTQTFGGILSPARMSFNSVNEAEDMSMELTTVLGGIQAQLAQEQDSEHSTNQPLANENSTPSTPPRNDAESVTPLSRRSHRGQQRLSSSPGRRSSARLRNSLAKIVEESNEDGSSKPNTPTNKTGSAGSREVANILTNQTVLTPRHIGRSLSQQAASNASQAPSPQPSNDGMLPSSPFYSVAASPAVIQAQDQHFFKLELPVPTTLQTDLPSLADNIKLLSTPRKETLKALSPTKKSRSPIKTPQLFAANPKNKPTPQASLEKEELNQSLPPVSLQAFLDEAGIRFMDLTTSKRRATIAHTPSRVHAVIEGQDGLTIPLDDAIISAACTEPELELYKHACNELRRYIDGGKADIKILEDATLADTPELISKYMAANKEERASIDSQLREIKTNARLRSKEMWYSWRSNLVDDLMKVLQSIAEGLLSDDDILQEKEKLVSKALPRFLEERARLRHEVDSLQAASNAFPIEEKEELEQAREQLRDTSRALEEKRQLMAELETQLAHREDTVMDLDKQKNNCLRIIEKSEKSKAMSDTNATQELDQAKNLIEELESATGWAIPPSTSHPATMTMRYKSQLEFFFHPLAFKSSNTTSDLSGNEAISLSYIGEQHAVSTCQRFFLQLLRAQLHVLPQGLTKIGIVLQLISSTWDMALQVTEAMRCMSVECPTEEAILSDECLTITSSILLPATRTKVVAVIKLTARSPTDDTLSFVIGTDIKLVYGKMSSLDQPRRHFSESAAGGPTSWAPAIRQVQDLVRKMATGAALRRVN